jgi:hydroxymethylpyrimidine/phosphomethylpyrimidine kinase
VSADNRIRKALTIAGSDPSGGAGIQADLKTFSQLNVYGMAVIAALTAQNTLGVAGVVGVDPVFVAQQLDSVLSDITPDATKTGMLLTAGVIEAVAEKVKEYKVANLVVDPVLMSTTGAHLMQPEALTALRQSLLPLTTLITPNLHEASVLTGEPVTTIAEMERSARQICEMGPQYVLIKGGHLQGDAIDVLFNGDSFLQFRSPRVVTRHTHGTGCVLSASIAGHLALGRSITVAIELAKDLVTDALKHAVEIGSGAGPCSPLSFGGSSGG